MPSFYHFSEKATQRMVHEFLEVVARDYNHPSIITWVPFNESWGLSDLGSSPPQRHLVRSFYHLAKALDPNRLVIDNDGWEHQETDVFTIHDYMNDADLFTRRYGSYATLAKTIAPLRHLRVEDRVNDLQDRLLHDAVGDHRDTQRTPFLRVRRLRNVHP